MTWPAVVLLITIGQTSATPNAESAPDGKDITWRSVGPGGGGWIQSIGPVDRRILYVGTNDHPYHDAYAAAGLLKSHDGGLTWQRENSGLSHRGVHCLSVSPHDPSLLYLGTGGNGAFIGKDTVIRSSYGSAPASKP